MENKKNITKADERKVLEQIKKIVEGLGEESYIGTAFKGVFELAEENIEYDAAFSAKFYMEEYDEQGNEVKLTEYIAKHAQEECEVTAEDVMEGCCFECMDCPLGILNTIAIQAAELRHRLSELEDKLEEGTLVELPCKVGDTVYIVGRKYRAGSYESFINTGKFRYSDIEKFGDIVFITREAAEARLKELEK